MKYNEKIYYSTFQEEVVNFKFKEIPIDKNYKYIHPNPFYKFWSWLTYRLMATPFAFISFKLIKKIKFHNTKILKKHKKGGYFIYANHTNQYADGFCPALITFPKKPHIIVNSTNISIPIIGRFSKMWGAIPIPNDFKATKNFYLSIEHTLKKNNPIMIYPEAHLWPYYTKIREFSNVSFRYPVKYKKPTFTFTTIYKKKKHSNKPKIEIFVDGPFYINENLADKDAQEELKNTVFNTLKDRAKLSDYEFVQYIKKEETQ